MPTRRWFRWSIFTFVIIALAVVMTPAAAQTGTCPVGKDGHALTSVAGQCVDETPLTPSQQAVLNLKNRAAQAYQAYLDGRGSLAAAQATVANAANAAGVEAPVLSSAASGSYGGVHPLTALSYSPFEQINGNYCGPATAESMLYYQAQRDSAHYTSSDYDTVTGAYDTISGTSSSDQPLLANSFWLATDKYGQTYWGTPYMPFTLNGWLGGSWYVQVASPGNGGSLTESQYYADLETDVGSSYVMAEDVIYDGATYYPSGFNPSGTYRHWDTLYGYATVAGVNDVQQGQVYASPGYTWEPWQLIPEDTAWSAVDQGNGIVW